MRRMKSERGAAAVLIPLAYLFVLTLGLLQAWAVRHSMQSDGISYLDMGDAIMHADGSMAINAYWSPLYPLLLGLALRVLNPSVQWQFTVVHLVNFAIFAFAFVCFDLFLRDLLPLVRVNGRQARSHTLPRWVLLLIGYLTFAWLALRMITLERVSPDMLMAAFVLLASRQLLRLREGQPSLRSFALLGIILGLGYLAKAPIFPLAFVILAAVLFSGLDWRTRIAGVLSALLVFLCVSGPYIWLISANKKRLVISESGRINYLFFVNQTSPGWYFQNLGSAGGRYLHTAHKIHASPAIYQFASPIGGTQPIWYDPSYWSDGAIPRIQIRPWIALIGTNLRAYARILWHDQTIPFVAFALLVYVSELRGSSIREQWPVLLLAFAGLAMYTLVLVEPRYTAVFFILFWAVCLRALQEPRRVPRSRHYMAVALFTTVLLAVALGWSTARMLSYSSVYDSEASAAEQLKSLGISHGAKVARIGGLLAASWARLAGVSVIAEVPGDEAADFWAAPADNQAQMIDQFRNLGAKAIVAERTAETNAFHPGQPWRSLEASNRFYALVF